MHIVHLRVTSRGEEPERILDAVAEAFGVVRGPGEDHWVVEVPEGESLDHGRTVVRRRLEEVDPDWQRWLELR